MSRSTSLVASAAVLILLLGPVRAASGNAATQSGANDSQSDAQSDQSGSAQGDDKRSTMGLAPEDDPAPPKAAEDYTSSITLGPQTYSDPAERFGFTAPLDWARTMADAQDEVTFQSPSGDSLRVSIVPLRVDPKTFQSTYVNTYLDVLAQTFSDVRFIGQRQIQVSEHDATDYVFTGQFHARPALCHQVVILGNDSIIYITFAAFGQQRNLAEQSFLATVLGFWIEPSFGLSKASGSSIPPFTFPVPENWTEEVQADGSHTYRPPNARPTSAVITVFSFKPTAGDPATVDNSFAQLYQGRIQTLFNQGKCQIQRTTSGTLSGEQAVRYDLGYVTQEGGLRRVILSLCMHNGYVVGLSCDAADSGFPIYERAFEDAYANFHFKQ